MISHLTLSRSFYAVFFATLCWVGGTPGLATTPVPLSDPLLPAWEVFDTYNGIEMSRRKIPGNPILAYRGTGTLNAPMAKLVSAVIDTPRKPEWMSRIQKAAVLKHYGPHDRLEYIHVETPWPVTDRDFLYRTQVIFNETEQKVKITFRSVVDDSHPDLSGRVRANIYNSSFTLTPIDGGRRTRVEAEAHADPKGFLPVWLVNIYQKKLPRESLEGLLRQVKKSTVPENLEVKRMLAPPSHAVSRTSPER